jgi:hypothetical protein
VSLTLLLLLVALLAAELRAPLCGRTVPCWLLAVLNEAAELLSSSLSHPDKAGPAASTSAAPIA